MTNIIPILILTLALSSCNDANISDVFSASAGHMFDTKIQNLEKGKKLEIQFKDFGHGNEWVPAVVLRFGIKDSKDGTLVAISKKTPHQEFLDVAFIKVESGNQTITKVLPSRIRLKDSFTISINNCKDNSCSIVVNNETPEIFSLLGLPYDTTVLVSSGKASIRVLLE